MEISRALSIVRAMATVAATGVEQTAMAHHVDRFVRSVLGVSAGSVADLKAMPRDLSRLLLRTEELESDVRDRWGRWELAVREPPMRRYWRRPFWGINIPSFGLVWKSIANGKRTR